MSEIILKYLKMILDMYVSPLYVMCIKIPVKESSFDVIVSHISSLTSFSFIVELVFYFSANGKQIMYSPLLFTGTFDRYI